MKHAFTAITHESVCKYAATLAQLVAFCLRLAARPNPTICTVPPVIVRLAKQLTGQLARRDQEQGGQTFRKLVRAITTQPVSWASVDRAECVALCFILCLTASRNAQFSQAVTVPVAHLRFAMRGCIGFALLELAPGSAAQQEQEATRLLHWVQASLHYSPIAAITDIANLATAHLPGYQAVTRVSWIVPGDSLYISGQQVTLPGLRDGIQHLIAGVTLALGRLCDGMQDLLQKVSLDTVGRDAITHDRVGEWIRDTSPMAKHLDEVLLNRLATPGFALHSRFFTLKSGGEFTMKAAAFRRFDDEHLALLKQLMLLVHICGGLPPRGTELLTLTWANVADHGRSLYFLPNRANVSLEYNKTANVTKRTGAVITRSLPPCVANLLLQYMVLVKPLDLVFYRASNPGHEGIAPCPWLFQTHGKVWTKYALYDYFSQTWLEAFGYPLSISLYRHVVTAFTRKRFPQALMQVFAAADLQAGHSSVVANAVYGREAEDQDDDWSASSRSISQEQYEAISHLVHQMYGIAPGEPASLQQPAESRSIAPPGSVAVRDLLVATAPPRQPTPLALQPSIQSLHQETWAGLRRLYGPDCDWVSSHQAQACVAVMQRKDLLAVLPTGGGKSTIYLIPAVMRSQSIIVLVATVALEQQIQQTCERHQLSCTAWTATADPLVASSLPSVITVMIESAGTKAFRQQLSQWTAAEVIHHIVLDEVHLIQQWATFRPAMLEVASLRAMRPIVPQCQG